MLWIKKSNYLILHIISRFLISDRGECGTAVFVFALWEGPEGGRPPLRRAAPCLPAWLHWPRLSPPIAPDGAQYEPADPSEHDFEMVDGVMYVWTDDAREELLAAPPGTAVEFFTDMHQMLKIIAMGPVKTLCHHRLQLLEQKFNLHCMLNADKEFLAQKASAPGHPAPADQPFPSPLGKLLSSLICILLEIIYFMQPVSWHYMHISSFQAVFVAHAHQ